MDNTDVIARCVAASGAARVVVVIATEFAREAARRHGARGAAALAMGRAGAAGLLLATLTKGAERVTLQILGNGPLGGLTVDSSSEGTARVFVGNPRFTTLVNAGPRPRLGDAVGTEGEGMVSVVRDLGMRDTFSGRTPLVDGEIDSDVERYLTDSEQIDSTLGCEVFLAGDGDVQFAAGLLVQTLPGGLGTDLVAATRSRLRSGEVAETLSRRLAQRGTGEITTDLVAAAALGDDFASLMQLGPSRPVRFHCPCSWERAASTLALLGEHELVSMIEEDGHGQVTCEFCRTSYSFTDENLDTIRRTLKSAAPPPS